MAEVINKRKRKMDSCIVSVSGDNSGGDIKQRKCSYKKNKVDKRCQRFFVDGHVSTVYIGNNVLSKYGPKESCSSSGDSNEAPQMFRFNCSLGDQWLERYSPSQGQSKNRRKIKISTGDYESDVALSKLVSNGFLSRETLSKGKYSNVVLSTNTLERRDVVIKIVKSNLKSSNPSKFKTCCGSRTSLDDPDEIQILSSLNHQNIVDMLSHMVINNRHLIFLALCDNGNITSLLKSKEAGLLPEKVVKRYARDIVNGVEYLHNQTISHCGISVDNCLIDKFDRVRLCGFGCAVQFGLGSSLITSFPPQMPFHPPEVLMRNPYNPKKVDIWEIGILLYKMLTGHYLFGEKEKKIPTRAQRTLVFDQRQYKLTKDLNNLLLHMLKYNPDKRPTILQIKDDAWFIPCETKTVSIGYHYLTRRPKRGQQSTLEEEKKREYGI